MKPRNLPDLKISNTPFMKALPATNEFIITTVENGGMVIDCKGGISNKSHLKFTN
jgi:hypothetical protein